MPLVHTLKLEMVGIDRKPLERRNGTSRREDRNDSKHRAVRSTDMERKTLLWIVLQLQASNIGPVFN